MIYKFRLISDESDDFMREIKLDSDATFYDFHKAILKATGYKDDQMTSFFPCDDNWDKETEITLEDMGADSRSDIDTFVMKETPLSELLEDEKQKLIYVFDPLTERVFFIELSEIITGKNLDEAVISHKIGTPPPQTVDFDEQFNLKQGIDLDEDFYGSDEFEDSELTDDGFAFSEGNPYDNDFY